MAIPVVFLAGIAGAITLLSSLFPISVIAAQRGTQSPMSFRGSAISGQTEPDVPHIQPALPDPAGPVDPVGCIKGGCSGQLCVDASKPPIATTCEWREEYACYQTAICELQPDGSCGFRKTPELVACLQGTSRPPPPTSICGNGICDPGEADESWCPPCSEGEPCPMMPCSLEPGTCPSDCTGTITPAPEPTKQPRLCDISCPEGMVLLSKPCRCRPKPKPTWFPWPSLPPRPIPIVTPIMHDDSCTGDGLFRLGTRFCLRLPGFGGISAWVRALRTETVR
jgi:hypothetical protein